MTDTSKEAVEKLAVFLELGRVITSKERRAADTLRALVAERDFWRKLAQDTEIERQDAVFAREDAMKGCDHPRSVRQHTGDGTPLDFCPDCGRNVWIGSMPEEAP